MKTSLTAKLAKGLPALLAAVAFMQSPGASAAPAIGVNPFGTGPGGGYTAVDLMTNLTDSALAVGFNPGLLIPPGSPYDIRLVSQARVGAFQNNGAVVVPGGAFAVLNGNPAVFTSPPFFNYEVTKVLDIQERVLTNNGTNANFGNAVQTADVDTAHAGLQQLAIYFDPLSTTDTSQAVPGNGAGTVRCYGAGATSTPALCGPGGDGVLALSAHLVNNVSSFAASGAIGTGSFDLTFVIDFVNPAFLNATVGGIIGEHITGTTNVPSFFTPATMWDGTASATGLLLKVDSSQSFVATPEPGSLALMGLALAGLGASVARRRTK